MVIMVSTTSFNSSIPSSATRFLRFPSKENGFVTTATVRAPISLLISAMTGAPPVPVPPPMPAVMKTMSLPSSIFLISSMLSSAASLPISGFAPAPSPLVSPLPI